jgi:hypothetical protein
MHRPPAVSHSVARSKWHASLLAVVWLATLGPLGYFSHTQSSLSIAGALAGLWLIGGGAALRAWRNSAKGLLQWDGEYWHWICDGQAQQCHVGIVWDFQRLLLVRIVIADGPSHWMWLESGRSDRQWDALRRALVNASLPFTAPSPTEGLEGQR